MDLTKLTASELRKGYLNGDFTSAQVTKAYLEKIEKENPDLNAYLEVFPDAIDMAKVADEILKKEGDKAHPLCGIPIATKDNILIEGKIASAASKMLENHVATYDSTVVKKLKEAHVVFLGRTNMDEFAMGSSTEHSAFGVTKNPLDTERVPGGSSGGSAAAVASGLAPIALGSETCGSIRQPASLCGLVGFKPTYGAVSRSGLIAMGSSLDQIGPFARTVSDVEILFDTIKGKDKMDSTTLPDEGETDVETKKIGVPWKFVERASSGAQENFKKALEELKKEGYEVVDIDIPSADYALAAYYIVMPAEVSTNLARLDGVRYGLHIDGKDLLDDYKKSRAGGFGPETRRRIILGTYVLSSGYYDAYYGKATALRSTMKKDLDTAFEHVAFIATPTTPDAAFKIGEKSDPVSMYLEDVFAAPANLTGIPAISVPFGSTKRDGKELPVGVQFMSPKRTEKALFRIAKDLMGEE